MATANDSIVVDDIETLNEDVETSTYSTPIGEKFVGFLFFNNNFCVFSRS
jgi:hypothetical protein